MQQTFNHFREIFKGNKKLYEFIRFLTVNHIILSKPVTDCPIQDGYEICFLDCHCEMLQEIFNNFDFESLKNASKLSKNIHNDIRIDVHLCLAALKKFKEAGAFDNFLNQKL